jgi:hypothetical protein
LRGPLSNSLRFSGDGDFYVTRTGPQIQRRRNRPHRTLSPLDLASDKRPTLPLKNARVVESTDDQSNSPATAISPFGSHSCAKHWIHVTLHLPARFIHQTLLFAPSFTGFEYNHAKGIVLGYAHCMNTGSIRIKPATLSTGSVCPHHIPTKCRRIVPIQMTEDISRRPGI